MLYNSFYINLNDTTCVPHHIYIYILLFDTQLHVISHLIVILLTVTWNTHILIQLILHQLEWHQMCYISYILLFGTYMHVIITCYVILLTVTWNIMLQNIRCSGKKWLSIFLPKHFSNHNNLSVKSWIYFRKHYPLKVPEFSDSDCSCIISYLLLSSFTEKELSNYYLRTTQLITNIFWSNMSFWYFLDIFKNTFLSKGS